MSKTTIKSAMVIDKFIHHPGSGRAADNENDVATCRGPSIPEMLQGRDKIRACSIHPRQFIKKNHLTFYPVQRVEIRDKHLESIEPVVGIVWKKLWGWHGRSGMEGVRRYGRYGWNGRNGWNSVQRYNFSLILPNLGV
jgi:hypothetical protein